jgi:choline-sulfatase
MLFNLGADPDELDNLAGQAAHAEVERRMHARAIENWDPEEVHARILASQRRRLFLAEVAASSDLYSNWSFQPFVDASKRYIRGAGSTGPTHAKSRARFPYVPPVPPDRKS